MLVVGLFIAVVGISIISVHSQTQPQTSTESAHKSCIIPIPDTWQHTWAISCYLEQGDNVTVEFNEHYNWTNGAFDIADDGSTLVMYVFIDIVDPYGNTTTFVVELAVMESGSGLVRRLFSWNKYVLKNGTIDWHSMLDDEGRLEAVGGIIPFNGEYTAKVTVGPDRETEPPSFLGFFHDVMETKTQYPNSYFLPTGAAMVVIGSTMSFFGLKTGTHPKKGRYRITHKNRKQ